MNFVSTRLITNDIKRLVRFYEEVTGLTAKRYTDDFAESVGEVPPTGRYVEWEVMNIFRYDDDDRLAEEWMQTDSRTFLKKLTESGDGMQAGAP